jgi:GTPase SAR1 family protein
MPTVPIPSPHIVVELAKPGVARLRMFVKGKKVIVVGPPGAGKSTFMDYLRYEVFDPEQSPEVTIRPRTAKNFKFALGRRDSLVASIKCALDMPGQPDPRWVAEEVFRERPHALIVILDSTAPTDDKDDQRSTAIWLRRFSKAAEQMAREMRGKRNRLRTVVVALNKADKASEQELQTKEARCKEVLEDWRAGGVGAAPPRVLRCISVSVPGRTDGTNWINAVLSDVAIGLKERG